MAETITIPRREYEDLKKKADIFNTIVETERLSATELRRLEKARRGSSITEGEFLKRHPELKG
ncbi:MAG: hypothetical protein HY051_01500 [Candidatus Aenigmarchaeota archaeon]|nr:hypothetical protein [Candidatus Aenigmarchaeota archaeon]